MATVEDEALIVARERVAFVRGMRAALDTMRNDKPESTECWIAQTAVLLKWNELIDAAYPASDPLEEFDRMCDDAAAIYAIAKTQE